MRPEQHNVFKNGKVVLILLGFIVELGWYQKKSEDKKQRKVSTPWLVNHSDGIFKFSYIGFSNKVIEPKNEKNEHNHSQVPQFLPHVGVMHFVFENESVVKFHTFEEVHIKTMKTIKGNG